MPERSADWMRQAKRDLASARSQREAGFHEWACFVAQQAAEKALKAVYQRRAAEAWGHSLHDLLRGLHEGTDVPDEVAGSALSLDKLYIISRYPNGWPSGSPGDSLTKRDADAAISDSERIIQFCSGLLA